MASADRASLNWLARAGYAARGVVFVILACFTAIAALDAHEATGLAGALTIIKRQA